MVCWLACATSRLFLFARQLNADSSSRLNWPARSRPRADGSRGSPTAPGSRGRGAEKSTSRRGPMKINDTSGSGSGGVDGNEARQTDGRTDGRQRRRMFARRGWPSRPASHGASTLSAAPHPEWTRRLLLLIWQSHFTAGRREKRRRSENPTTSIYLTLFYYISSYFIPADNERRQHCLLGSARLGRPFKESLRSSSPLGETIRHAQTDADSHSDDVANGKEAARREDREGGAIRHSRATRAHTASSRTARTPLGLTGSLNSSSTPIGRAPNR